MVAVLFVKNMADGFGWRSLRNLFKVHGKVVYATRVRTKTGLHTNHGFVTMQNHDSARRAIEALNGFKWRQSCDPLFVTYYVPEPKRLTKLYISDIDEKISLELLKRLFETWGPVSLLDVKPGASHGFVHFLYSEHGHLAMEQMHGMKIGKSTLRVRKAYTKSRMERKWNHHEEQEFADDLSDDEEEEEQQPHSDDDEEEEQQQQFAPGPNERYDNDEKKEEQGPDDLPDDKE